ncbi:hypothetical protein FMEAI12_3130052 [Parafrankia sp. Ea1.12]|nr:hypothetical protein FMEAI12_3130052 [Parafrankia sp. Ea1.12]
MGHVYAVGHNPDGGVGEPTPRGGAGHSPPIVVTHVTGRRIPSRIPATGGAAFLPRLGAGPGRPSGPAGRPVGGRRDAAAPTLPTAADPPAHRLTSRSTGHPGAGVPGTTEQSPPAGSPPPRCRLPAPGPRRPLSSHLAVTHGSAPLPVGMVT